MDRLVYIEEKLRGLRPTLLHRTQESLDINFKTSHADIVTKYDMLVETFLCEEIAKVFDDDVFFTEEETHNTLGEKMWIIDPIDGTCNFAVKGRDYAISIAYYESYKEVFGIVYDVERDVLYKSIKGQGAFINDIPIPQLPSKYNLKEELFDISFPAIKNIHKHYNIDFSHMANEFLGHRACGSAALAICYVAEGTLGSYTSFKLCPWDYAGAKIILEEVGGYCAIFDGNTMQQKYPIDERPRTFFATKSKAMLDEMMEKLQGNMV